MTYKEFIDILVKIGFKLSKIKKGDKLLICFDFEENKGNFKRMLNFKNEIWFNEVRSKLTEYEKFEIGGKTFLGWYEN